MKNNTPPRNKLYIAIIAALFCNSAGATAIDWTSTSGDWQTPDNWNSNPSLPGSADDVNINVSVPQSITHGTGYNTINTLTTSAEANLTINGGSSLSISNGGSNAGTLQSGGVSAGTLSLNGGTLNNTGGSLSAASNGLINLNGVTVVGGSINTSGTGRISAANNSNNFLDAATLNGTLDLASTYGVERVVNGLTLNGSINVNNNSILAFEGDQTLGGNGAIVLGDTGGSNRISIEGNSTLTLGSGVLMHGQNGTIGNQNFNGGTNTLVNQGTIAADVNGGVISLVANATTNNGTLQALNGGELDLYGNITSVGGQINAGAGSSVVQKGGTLQLSNLNLSGAGSFIQDGGTLTGVVTPSVTGSFVVANNSNNFLDAATLNGTLDMASAFGVERVVNGLTLNGNINVNNESILAFQGDQTLGGNGAIVLGDTSNYWNRISIDGDSTLTVASGVLVHGQNGTIGNQWFVGGTNTLVNQGTIAADVNGGVISIAANATTNNGTLQALNGGELDLYGNITSAGGHINAGAGSSVVQKGGTQDMTNIGLTGAGSFIQDGGTLTGVVTPSGTGSFVVANNGNNFLDAATLNGTLDLASTTGIERVVNGLTLNGSINVNNNSILAFEGDQTLGGNGAIVLGDTGGSNRISIEGNSTLTLGSGVLMHGQNGTIGNQNFNGGTNTLVNQGTIAADVSGGVISVVANATTNDTGGILRADNGGTLQLFNTVTNKGTLEALNGGELDLYGNITSVGGQINAGAGSSVVQKGGTLQLSNLNLSGAGSFVQDGGTLTGVVTPSVTGRFVVANNSNNFLDAATLNGTLDMASATGIERVVNGLTLNGNINVNNYSTLAFQGDQTLGGNGAIVLGDSNYYNQIGIDGDSTLTVASGVLMHGQNGTIGRQNFVGGTNNALVNQGTIAADVNGGVISVVANATTNDTGGILRADNGGTLQLYNTVTNKGTLEALTNSNVAVFNTFNNTGSVNVQTNSTLAFNGAAADFSNDGLVNLASGATLSAGNLTNKAGGQINGNGTVDLGGSGSLTNLGQLVVGNSPGRLTINGNLALLSGSSLDIKLSSLSDFGQVLVRNNVSLGGMLDIYAANGFAPSTGSSFDFLYYSGVMGNFDGVQLFGFGSGVTASLTSLSDHLRLDLNVAAVPLPGAGWLFVSAASMLVLSSRRNAATKKAA